MTFVIYRQNSRSHVPMANPNVHMACPVGRSQKNAHSHLHLLQQSVLVNRPLLQLAATQPITTSVVLALTNCMTGKLVAFSSCCIHYSCMGEIFYVILTSIYFYVANRTVLSIALEALKRNVLRGKFVISIREFFAFLSGIALRFPVRYDALRHLIHIIFVS